MNSNNAKAVLSSLNDVRPILSAMADQNGLLSSTLVKEIKSGAKTLTHTRLTIKRDFASLAEGTKQMIEASQDKDTGISDFDGQRVQTGEAFVINNVAWRYADAANLANAEYTTKLPKGLVSAELRIISDGVLKTKHYGRDFFVEAPGTETANDFSHLDISKVVGDEKPFKIEFEVPAGATIPSPTNKHCLAVDLDVYQVVNAG